MASVTATLALAGALWSGHDAASLVVWSVIVPLLPLWWYVAPGLWRNVCPMAAASQLPRAIGRSKTAPAPTWVRQYGYLLAVASFTGLLIARKAGLDHDGRALAALLVVLLLAACLSGWRLAGKSGWCASVCPLRPVQGLYAREAIAHVASACRPCVGCVSDCQDLGRDTSHVRRSLAEGPALVRQRALFAGLLPGLIVGFYTTGEGLGALPTIALCAMTSLGIWSLVEAGSRWSVDHLTVISGALSLNLFYWFNTPLVLSSAAELLTIAVPDTVRWVVHENILALTVVTSVQAWRRHRMQAPAPGTVTMSRGIPVVRRDATPEVPTEETVTVTVLPENRRRAVPAGTTLAEALDGMGLGSGTGCGQGLCGNDPVFVLAGSVRMSPPTESERLTLERLDLPDNARLACTARVHGDVEISLTRPTDALDQILVTTAGTPRGSTPERLVIVGGGVAGVTAAERLRALDSDAEVELIAAEVGPLYNRMALGDLLRAPGALNRLRLRADDWASRNGIRVRTGSPVSAIDRAGQAVVLDSGERVHYDRLILATGAAAARLDVEGWELDGVHVLRTAEEASAVGRSLASGTTRSAVVVGGGPLGVETAVALRARGWDVELLVRDDQLMKELLDERAARQLRSALTAAGIDVELSCEVARLHGEGRLEGVALTDGRVVEARLMVACIGIDRNTAPARAAGLEVARGIVVDDELRTSDPLIFAIGDVAEHAGRPGALWSPAERQAEVAARNALGGVLRYVPGPELTQVRAPDLALDIVVVGARGTDTPIVLEDPALNSYRRLDSTDGLLTGAVLVNARPWERAVSAGVASGRRVDDIREHLASGDWEQLRSSSPSPSPAPLA